MYLKFLLVVDIWLKLSWDKMALTCFAHVPIYKRTDNSEIHP